MSMMLTRTRAGGINYSRSQGVSLIEILVALFTLSIGLLGLAAMQAKTLQFNQSSYLRTQATLMASDIIDRMRANPDQLNAYELALSDTVTSSSCDGSTCTPAQMADADIFQWRSRLSNQLPEGNGAIAESAAGDDIYVVTVQWRDRDDSTKSFVVEAQL